MNWFYVKHGAQAGPVDRAELDRLAQTGEVTRETLVWMQGMASWQPYATVAGNPPPPPAPLAPGLVRCAECGQGFPPEQLITLAGRTVCGACKPVAVQKFQEGVVSFGRTVDAEELWQRVQQRGFDFTIGSVLSRSWELVKSNYWPCVGVTLLCYVVMMGAGQVPLLGILAAFLVQPQIMAGLYWYFLRQFRGEGATVNDSFAGFRRGYGQQALYMVVVFGIILGVVILCAVPMVLIMAATSKSHSDSSFAIWGAVALLIPMMLVMWYFMVCWIFTPILILDKGLDALAAMKLSRRVVRLRFWKLVGLFFVTGMICMLGLLALIIGAIFLLPLFFAALSRVYEDAFGEEGPVLQG